MLPHICLSVCKDSVICAKRHVEDKDKCAPDCFMLQERSSVKLPSLPHRPFSVSLSRVLD